MKLYKSKAYLVLLTPKHAHFIPLNCIVIFLTLADTQSPPPGQHSESARLKATRQRALLCSRHLPSALRVGKEGRAMVHYGAASPRASFCTWLAACLVWTSGSPISGCLQGHPTVSQRNSTCKTEPQPWATAVLTAPEGLPHRPQPRTCPGPEGCFPSGWPTRRLGTALPSPLHPPTEPSLTPCTVPPQLCASARAWAPPAWLSGLPSSTKDSAVLQAPEPGLLTEAHARRPGPLAPSRGGADPLPHANSSLCIRVPAVRTSHPVQWGSLTSGL